MTKDGLVRGCVCVKLVGHLKAGFGSNDATSMGYSGHRLAKHKSEETRGRVRRGTGVRLREKKVHAQKGSPKTNIGAG